MHVPRAGRSSARRWKKFRHDQTPSKGSVFMNAFEIFQDNPFGLGGVPFGNEFGYLTDEVAFATIEAAWNAGVRYYDTSPWYGLGLAERRLGAFLHKQTRGEYVLSSKVGKLLTASRDNDAKDYFPFTSSPNNLHYDYTATASNARSKTACNG